MFIGSINGQVRSILARFSKSLSGQPVYVGCSGNFTVERVLSSTGTGEFHSNDVSLYSCSLGSHLAGDSIDVHVTDDELSWMGEYLQPGVPSIATLLLCSEMLQHYQRPEPYHRRMWKAYQSRFAVMHDATLQKVEKAIDGLVITSFSPSDVVEFVSQAPEDAVVVCFPPTYKGGYERLYKVMDSVFAWDAPAYATFDEDRFVELAEMVKARPVWMTLRDQPEPVLDGYLTGVVQTGLRSKPVYVYSSEHDTTLAMPRQTIETVPLPRLEAVALMLMLESFERHLTDLSDGWLSEEGEVKHKNWVPLASVTGTDTIPPESARVIKQAVDTMMAREEVGAKNRWQALEYWAADYLAGG